MQLAEHQAQRYISVHWSEIAYAAGLNTSEQGWKSNCNSYLPQEGATATSMSFDSLYGLISLSHDFSYHQTIWKSMAKINRTP